jgi:hypothetical protein
MDYTIPIIVGGLLVAFFLWLHFFVRSIHRRQLATLAQLACPSCRTAYGADAASEARQHYLDYIRDTRRELPQYRINFARCWKVRCPQCGSEAFFHYERAELETRAA